MFRIAIITMLPLYVVAWIGGWIVNPTVQAKAMPGHSAIAAKSPARKSLPEPGLPAPGAALSATADALKTLMSHIGTLTQSVMLALPAQVAGWVVTLGLILAGVGATSLVNAWRK